MKYGRVAVSDGARLAYIELMAAELLSAWGLALADHAEGRDDAASDRCRQVLERWQHTEERHYAISPLRWAATFFADVVRLLAVGRTNREIAGEPFVSTRTVDMHVRNLLRKLDCRSRADAARRASEVGLLAPRDGNESGKHGNPADARGRAPV
jgi:DNA-binding CsgD family transcriptional regulator